MKIVYFGSAFNPPHRGHMAAMAYLMTQADLVLAGPSMNHAFGKKPLPLERRVHLLQQMLSLNNLGKVQVSLIEEALSNTHNPLYTYDVLKALQEQYPQDKICFGLGPDNVDVFHKFYKHDELAEEFEMMVVPSQPFERSTLIRQAIKNNDRETVAQCMHPSLVDQMMTEPFYQE